MDRFGDIVTLTPAFPPAIPVNAIHDALAHPLGTPRLREMASGKKRVVCLLEDASRPARTAGVVEAVLEELDAARPAPPHIEVVFAYGAHIGLEEASIFRKLPAGFCLPVHHHDARAKLAKIGQTAGGTPIHLHPAVVEADLRVGIGTTNFHPAAGFSGGAKLLLPGVAGLDTIFTHHSLPPASRGLKTCAWRKEINSVTDQVALDFLVAMLVRPDGGLAGIKAGAHKPCEEAAQYELTRYARLNRPDPAGFCLVGMKPFDRSLLGFFKAVDLCLQLLASNGTGVIAGDCPEGVGRHLWRWSPEVIAWTRERLAGQMAGRRMYLLAPGVGSSDVKRLLPEGIIHLQDERAAASLAEQTPGPKCVVPYGPLTSFAPLS